MVARCWGCERVPLKNVDDRMGECALPVLMMFDNRRREWCGPVLMVLNDQPRECACPRPVGTRGGCGAGWGPGACPCGSSIRWGSMRQDGRTPTRTSTRPTHPPHPAPCPYRTRDAHFPIQLSHIIRTLGTQAFRWCNYPIRLSNIIRCAGVFA